MRHVAQLNGAGVCIAVSTLRELPAGPLFVEVPSADASYLGRSYSAGVWGAAPQAPARRLSRREFWRLWTRDERESYQDVLANGTPAQRRRLAAFAEVIADGDIDLTEAYIINRVTWCESNGANVLGAGVSIIALGRAAQILSGA